MNPRTGHERGTDERFCAGFFMVAIDERGTRAYPEKRRARAFRRLRKMRRVSGEFNGDTQERGSEWVGGQDQYVGTTHVAMGICTSVDALGAACGKGSFEQARGHAGASRLEYRYLTCRRCR